MTVTGGFDTPLARARSHLFPNSSRVESWLGLRAEKVGGPSEAHLHSQALPCVYPAGFFVPSVCTRDSFSVL